MVDVRWLRWDGMTTIDWELIREPVEDLLSLWHAAGNYLISDMNSYLELNLFDCLFNLTT